MRVPVAGVYFLRMGEYVKIGVSTDVISRVESFATAAPARLDLLGIIPGARRAEERGATSAVCPSPCQR